MNLSFYYKQYLSFSGGYNFSLWIIKLSQNALLKSVLKSAFEKSNPKKIVHGNYKKFKKAPLKNN